MTSKKLESGVVADSVSEQQSETKTNTSSWLKNENLIISLAFSVIVMYLCLLDSNVNNNEPVITEHASFDIAINGKPAGRIVFGLFGNDTPKTVQYFKQFCTGVNGYGYNNSVFRKIIQNYVIEGGDVVKESGGDNTFIQEYRIYEENFKTAHKVGALSMVNSGSGASSPHFAIVTGPARWLDGKDVVFGRVISGVNLIRRIDVIKTYHDDKPKS